MTEEDAQRWLAAQGWWDGKAGDRLRGFVTRLLEEADRQNLISMNSRAHIWARHIVDSAQLVRLAGRLTDGLWLDLGTGAGLPGLVAACLVEMPVTLIEARPLRTAFLQRCVEALDLAHVTVRTDKVERTQLDRPASVISARAFAPLDRLFAIAHHLSDENTVWLLPKGRHAEKELEKIERDWQAMFHVEHSLTDPDSSIVILRQLRRRPAGSSKPSSAQKIRKRSRRA